MICDQGQVYEDDIFYDSFGMKVWEKRHLVVGLILQQNKAKKVLDLGCADGKFLQRLSRSHDFEYLVGMDIDDEVLKQAVSNLYPEQIQEQIKFEREQQLVVKIFQGSAFEKYEEFEEIKFDACSMIELIEHVQLNELQFIEENVFGYLKIPLIIVTTPNQDFNYFFDFFKDNPKKMRHWDHKYEFTRQQFQDWAEIICQKYNYQVEYQGVGENKNGDASKGACSQIAIFKRLLNIQNIQNQYSNQSSIVDEQKVHQEKISNTQNFELQQKESIQQENNMFDQQAKIKVDLTLLKQYLYPFQKYDAYKELYILIVHFYAKMMDKLNQQEQSELEQIDEYLYENRLLKVANLINSNRQIAKNPIINNNLANLINFLKENQDNFELSQDESYFKDKSWQEYIREEEDFGDYNSQQDQNDQNQEQLKKDQKQNFQKETLNSKIKYNDYEINYNKYETYNDIEY